MSIFNIFRKRKTIKKVVKQEEGQIVYGECLCWCPFHHLIIGWTDYEARRASIIANKPKHEISTRLRSFQPVQNVDKLPEDVRKLAHLARLDWYAYRDHLECVILENINALNALHKKEVPDTAWDGKKLVFPSISFPQHLFGP